MIILKIPKTENLINNDPVNYRTEYLTSNYLLSRITNNKSPEINMENHRQSEIKMNLLSCLGFEWEEKSIDIVEEKLEELITSDTYDYFTCLLSMSYDYLLSFIYLILKNKMTKNDIIKFFENTDDGRKKILIQKLSEESTVNISTVFKSKIDDINSLITNIDSYDGKYSISLSRYDGMKVKIDQKKYLNNANNYKYTKNIKWSMYSQFSAEIKDKINRIFSDLSNDNVDDGLIPSTNIPENIFENYKSSEPEAESEAAQIDDLETDKEVKININIPSTGEMTNPPSMNPIDSNNTLASDTVSVNDNVIVKENQNKIIEMMDALLGNQFYKFDIVPEVAIKRVMSGLSLFNIKDNSIIIDDAGKDIVESLFLHSALDENLNDSELIGKDNNWFYIKNKKYKNLDYMKLLSRYIVSDISGNNIDDFKENNSITSEDFTNFDYGVIEEFDISGIFKLGNNEEAPQFLLNSVVENLLNYMKNESSCLFNYDKDCTVLNSNMKIPFNISENILSAISQSTYNNITEIYENDIKPISENVSSYEVIYDLEMTISKIKERVLAIKYDKSKSIDYNILRLFVCDAYIKYLKSIENMNSTGSGNIYNIKESKIPEYIIRLVKTIELYNKSIYRTYSFICGLNEANTQLQKDQEFLTIGREIKKILEECAVNETE